MYLFLAVLGLRCCTGFSLVVGSEGYSLAVVLRILVVVASLVAEHRLWSTQASVVGARGLSCSAASGIFPDEGSNCVSYTGRWVLYH